jgi:uroporphyrin-III C-methyltransferase
MPVAVIENATGKAMRVLRAPIAELGDLVARERVKSPALIIVGEVASDADNKLHTLTLEYVQ